MMQNIYTQLDIDESGVATLWLNRPEKLNALNADFINELLFNFKIINENTTIRLLVLRARGKNFCAGADIEWMKASIDLSYEANLADAKNLGDMLWNLKHIRIPTLAIVHGATYGGAVGLMACCDMAIALDDVKICLSEVNIGLIPATIGPYVQQSIGYKNSLYYSMTAEIIDAQTALNIGLVQKVIATTDAIPALDQLDKALGCESHNFFIRFNGPTIDIPYHSSEQISGIAIAARSSAVSPKFEENPVFLTSSNALRNSRGDEIVCSLNLVIFIFTNLSSTYSSSY